MHTLLSRPRGSLFLFSRPSPPTPHLPCKGNLHLQLPRIQLMHHQLMLEDTREWTIISNLAFPSLICLSLALSLSLPPPLLLDVPEFLSLSLSPSFIPARSLATSLSRSLFYLLLPPLAIEEDKEKYFLGDWLCINRESHDLTRRWRRYTYFVAISLSTSVPRTIFQICRLIQNDDRIELMWSEEKTPRKARPASAVESLHSSWRDALKIIHWKRVRWIQESIADSHY